GAAVRGGGAGAVVERARPWGDRRVDTGDGGGRFAAGRRGGRRVSIRARLRGAGAVCRDAARDRRRWGGDSEVTDRAPDRGRRAEPRADRAATRRGGIGARG